MKRKTLKHVFYYSSAILALTFGASVVFTPTVYAESSEVEVRQETTIPLFDQVLESTALFPETLRNWSVQHDPDAPFNVSNISLANRVQGKKTKADQNTEAKVLSIAIVNRHTKGTPSRGGTDKAVYNFTNWQYVDTLVARALLSRLDTAGWRIIRH